LLQAGRDIRDETTVAKDCTDTASQCVQHTLTGPGTLLVAAGRDIDLGNQAGIVTRGNLDNPYLPEGGASIQLTTAGLMPDYASLKDYLAAVSGVSASVMNFDQFQATVARTLEKLGTAGLTTAEQNKLFFEILNKASLLKKQDGKKLDLTYFDGLIASQFPTLTGETPVGNLSNHSSQIKTEQGGSIDIFTPTGSVFAGLTMGKAVAKPSNQGLFTVRGGDINALVKNDFLVNQGRVFTLGGGDITLVSQFGNLEAGKGAKTASSAPPPLIVFGKDGSITVDVSGAVAGSGIATLSTKPGQPISDVNAVAPRGYVDAGDAGIKSTGSANFNTANLKGVDNITAGSGFSNAQASATLVAAPAAPPPPPPAASGNAADDAKKSMASTNTGTALANLSVELLGFGDVSAGTAGQSGGGSSTSDKDKDKD
jgi:hypothetical protein